MRGFSSLTQAQRFLTLHGLTQNVFRLGHHLLQAVNYRFLRTQGVSGWEGSRVCTQEVRVSLGESAVFHMPLINLEMAAPASPLGIKGSQRL